MRVQSLVDLADSLSVETCESLSIDEGCDICNREGVSFNRDGDSMCVFCVVEALRGAVIDCVGIDEDIRVELGYSGKRVVRFVVGEYMERVYKILGEVRN